MMERYKEVLEVNNDDEWTAMKPMIQKVMDARRDKRQAALYASHILFSVAGIDDRMLKRYEHLGSFEKAYANMKALAQYRNARGLSQPVLEWKYLLFNWNDRRGAILKAVELAKAAGLDMISFWPTNNPLYGWSYRYRLGCLNDIGVHCWKGREVDLRSSRAQNQRT